MVPLGPISFKMYTLYKNVQPVGPFRTNQFQNVQTVHTVQPVGPFGTNQFQNVHTVQPVVGVCCGGKQ